MHTTRRRGRGLARLAPLGIVGVLALGGLTACGGDDEPEAAAPEPAPSLDAPDVSAALDAIGDEGLVDTLGRALVISLPAASGYSVDGDVVTVEIDADSGETSASLCAIANAARDGVEAPAEIELAFSDGTVDCRR